MPFGSELGATVEGDFSLYAGFSEGDSTRPLRWTVNADKWVQLSGWVRWNEANEGVAAGEQRSFGGVALTGTTAEPPGIRDFVGATIFGPMHFAVFPTGKLFFRPMAAIVLVNGSWLSFDGCFYRI